MKLLVIFLMSMPVFAGEKYTLPKEILEARDKVLKSKEELDRNMLLRYEQLCFKEESSIAEKEEKLAYMSIFGFDCDGFIIETKIEMP